MGVSKPWEQQAGCVVARLTKRWVGGPCLTDCGDGCRWRVVLFIRIYRRRLAVKRLATFLLAGKGVHICVKAQQVRGGAHHSLTARRQADSHG